MKVPAHGWISGLAGLVLAGAAVSAEPLSGRYVGVEKPGLILTLTETAEGKISGTVVEADLSAPVVGKRVGDGFSGTVGLDDEKLPVSAVLVRKNRLVLQVGPPENRETIAFRRETPEAATRPKGTPVTGKRNVIINGRRLSDAEVARTEKSYQVRIADADYWYDRVLGAWGIRGGPAAGLILPGLDLGGALQADASGGGTKVFINGRELHPYDVRALQQITGPVAPGRYFITAQGLAGIEGGPPLWDLAAIVRAQSDNPTNTWSSKITGASGFSDGTTGAVFLPGGGIVSYGQ